MKALSQSIALALPDPKERDEVIIAAEEARRKRLPVEIRLGIGDLNAPVPARVLGHGSCIAEIIEQDLPLVVGTAKPDITIFTSKPKLRALAGIPRSDEAVVGSLPELAALAGALRLAGFTGSIAVDSAEIKPEVPLDVVSTVKRHLSPPLQVWLEARAQENRNGVSASDYAIEHSSQSMFRDLYELTDDRKLVVTIGSRPEAAFWAVRALVRRAALTRGLSVNPAFGLILHAAWIPWYRPHKGEPPLVNLLNGTCNEMNSALTRSYHPGAEASVTLKREAVKTTHLITKPGALKIAEAVRSPITALRFLREIEVAIGPRLSNTLGAFDWNPSASC